jgi:hypothetical protein
MAMKQLLCRKDEAIGITAVITAAIGGLRFVRHGLARYKTIMVIITPKWFMIVGWLRKLVGKPKNLDKL